MAGRYGRAEELAQWRGPQSFTAWIPLAEGTESSRAEVRDRCGALDALLDELGVVHALRIVVTREVEGCEPHLLLNVVHDVSDVEVVAAIAPHLLKAIGPLVQCASVEALSKRLREHELRHDTMFISNIRSSVAEVRRDAMLYRYLQTTLDEILDRNAALPAPRLHAELAKRARAEFAWLDETAPGETPQQRRLRMLDLLRTFASPFVLFLAEDAWASIQRIEHKALRRLTIGAFGLYALAIGILIGPVSLLSIRLVEWLEEDFVAESPSRAHLDAIDETEDWTRKNNVTLLVPIKPSIVRRLMIQLVLRQAEQGCRHFWTQGRLVHIPTIHYARLILTKGNRFMIFMSDYDGGLDRYLDDFLGVGRRAVVPISSNFHGCPPTKWLGNPADISVFRGRWRSLIRLRQHLEAYWYSAYPELETGQIRNHREVREGLLVPTITREEASAWIRKL